MKADAKDGATGAPRTGGAARRFLASPAVFALSALVFGLFMAFVLPAAAREAAAYTPEGAGFDTSFLYTPAQAAAKAGAYTTEGRLAYIAARWSFDLAYPLVYGLFMLAAWSFSLERLTRGSPLGRRLSLLPLLAPAFDYVENVAATVVVASYPAVPAGWAVAASVGTALKWAFVGLGLAGALILPAAALVQSLAARLGRRL